MARARHELLALLRRRRRRLLAVCVGTVVACGLVAGALVPEVLIGGIQITGRPRGGGADGTADAAEPPVPVRLEERLGVDGRERTANRHRWFALPARDRDRLIERYWGLARRAKEDSAELDRLVDRYVRFRRLPEARREQLRQAARRLRRFIDEEIGETDLARLASMDVPERAAYLRKLWRESGRGN
jgi:hypothetical protein